MALMTADSYSGILGLGTVFAVLLIWFSRSVARLKRFFLATTIMLLSGKILRLFSFFMGDKSKGISEFQSLLVYSKIIWAAIALFAIITAILFFADSKTPDKTLPLAVPIIIGSIFVACIIAMLFAVYYFSVIDTKTNIGFLKSFLRFNDSWGTHRGYMWIRSFYIFGDFSLYNKLFGCGPDTFATVFEPYFEGLKHYGDSSTNCAHNEYINYLITTGIFGLASYLSIIFGALKGAIKSASKNPIAIAFAVSVISYAVQAVVNLAQPITTPLFIIFIALCEAVARKQKTTE
jgi:O-antigen ligase